MSNNSTTIKSSQFVQWNNEPIQTKRKKNNETEHLPGNTSLVSGFGA